MEPKSATQPSLTATPGVKVNKEEIIRTLVREGHIMFTKAENLEDVTYEELISAQHNVIQELAKQKEDLLVKNTELFNNINQFYRAASAINVTVTRDSANKIVLTRV